MEQELKEKFYAAIKAFDFEGMARAFHEGDMQWHAEEWKEFIEAIRADAKREEREEILRFIRSRKHSKPYTEGENPLAHENKSGWNAALVYMADVLRSRDVTE